MLAACLTTIARDDIYGDYFDISKAGAKHTVEFNIHSWDSRRGNVDVCLDFLERPEEEFTSELIMTLDCVFQTSDGTLGHRTLHVRNRTVFSGSGLVGVGAFSEETTWIRIDVSVESTDPRVSTARLLIEGSLDVCPDLSGLTLW